MEKKTEQLNIRLTPSEKEDIEKRASDREQAIPDFLRDLLRFGMLPESPKR